MGSKKFYVPALGFKEERSDAARDAHKALSDAIDKYNAEIEKANAIRTDAIDQFAQAVTAYNDEIEGLNAYRQDVANECQDIYNERSETWQEGDKGDALQAMISTWEETFEAFDFSAPEELPTAEAPEDPADALLELPDSPE